MRPVIPIRNWLLAALPLLLGLLGSAVFSSNLFGIQNFSFQVRFDLSWLIGFAGIMISVPLWLALISRQMSETARHKAMREEQIKNAGQNREFLRRLDHELKNPLTIIRLGMLNLSEAGELNEDQSRSAARVNQQADRLRQLVVDLRRLTELESDAIETEVVDLVDVLEEAVLLAEEASSLPRKVHLSIQSTPWPLSAVLGDRELLILAFRNLIDNALKYSDPGDRVDLRATDDGETVTIEIADNGMGIPEGEISYIFEQLYRGDQARIKPGSGLGLPMVQRIVELHKGRVEVRSRDQTGTVFAVDLPIPTAV